jgi:hypothetical protein
MRKFIINAIPITALALFILIMLSGHILKKTVGISIPQSIDDIIEAVNNDSWDKAGNILDDFEKAWDKVLIWIQFSSERDEINKINSCIARLKGAIAAKDKSNALMELHEAYNHWTNLGK